MCTQALLSHLPNALDIINAVQLTRSYSYMQCALCPVSHSSSAIAHACALVYTCLCVCVCVWIMI